MKRKLLAFVLAMICLLMFFVTTTSAAVAPNDAIMPCYDNVQSGNFNFYVTSDGRLCVAVDYKGVSGVFTQAMISVEIEKRFLGLFWRTVEIGYPDDVWVEYSSVLNGSFTNIFPADGTGTYRAKITLSISGMFGTDDIIEKTIECVYE